MTEPRDTIAFPVFSPDQIDGLARFTEPRECAPSEALFKAGDTGFSFYIVVSGTVGIWESSGGEPRLVTVHEPGEFTGDVDMITGRPAVVTAIAGPGTRVLEVCPERLRRIVNEVPSISDVILRAFLQRRVLLLQGAFLGARVVGSRVSKDTLRIREFLAKNEVPFTWLDVEADPGVHALLDRFEIGIDDTPIVIFLDGTVLRRPDNAALALAAGLARPIERVTYDLAVIGAGPAGLATAVYGASEGLQTVVLDTQGPGGQAGQSSKIENYMGFPLGLSGADLAGRAVVQAQKFGAQFVTPATVVGMTCGGGVHRLRFDDGTELSTRCVIVATGASYRRLYVPDLDKYEGQGVYYAATHVEAILCVGAAVAVVGAGNSAGQAAVYLSERTRQVFLVVRGGDLRKTMSAYLVNRIEQTPNIEVLLNSEVVCIEGEPSLERATVLCAETGKNRTLDLVGLFVMIGASPRTEWLPDTVKTDAKGFILSGAEAQASGSWPLARDPHLLETTCPGVFAAGDVRSGSVKRVASAVGEGSMAVSFVHQILAGQ